MTSITAKVTVQSRHEHVGCAILTFVPDYAQGRNKEWASSTPQLELKMTVVEAVAQHFKPGQAYTLTFTPEES